MFVLHEMSLENPMTFQKRAVSGGVKRLCRMGNKIRIIFVRVRIYLRTCQHSKSIVSALTGRKLLESVRAYFFKLVLKHVITNVSRKSFFQHHMKAGTSTELFQNNKICTSSCSEICSCDVHILDLFHIFTPFLKYCAS